MSQDNIKLVRDIEKSRIILSGISVIVIPANLAPAKVDAKVEEQDTSLVLGKPDKITITDEKPSWYLANKLESQYVFEPGSVVSSRGQPVKLLAIIHDLDQDPTWKTEWISQALDNIFNLTRSRDITTLQLPILGAQHGRFSLKEFLSLLMQKLNDYNGPLRKIWLTVDSNDCPVALLHLKEIGK